MIAKYSMLWVYRRFHLISIFSIVCCGYIGGSSHLNQYDGNYDDGDDGSYREEDEGNYNEGNDIQNSYHHPQYQYQYGVDDNQSGDQKGQAEERDGDNMVIM
ncbi:hypothetical protein QE152_g8883 [Popillia japonica]|uniref:Uncharacterized protein n=1 Tax=Popillia japonica TaxID=7064 RepID=A0AAW1M0N9_POPJA